AGERFSRTWRRNLSVSASPSFGLRGSFGAQCFSEREKAVKKMTVKAAPEMVAVVFVNKLIPASENNTIVIRPKPRGISVHHTRKLSGTFQRSAFGSWNRSTKTARAFIAKL